MAALAGTRRSPWSEKRAGKRRNELRLLVSDSRFASFLVGVYAASRDILRATQERTERSTPADAGLMVRFTGGRGRIVRGPLVNSASPGAADCGAGR